MLQDNARDDAYVGAKERLDVMKLRGLLIPEKALTHETVTGSYNLAEQHVWILMETLKGLIIDLQDHFNTFLIPDLVGL